MLILQKKYFSIAAIIFIASALVGLSNMAQAQDVRIKDLVNVRGVRSNQLMGVGLVVGLNKSGDSAASLSTNKATAAMLQCKQQHQLRVFGTTGIVSELPLSA